MSTRWGRERGEQGEDREEERWENRRDTGEEKSRKN